MTTAALLVRQAVYDVLSTDAQLLASVGVPAVKTNGVFNGRAPQGTLMPYVVLGTLTENDLPMFNGGGTSSSETIHVWSGKAGSTEFLTIYGHIVRLLSGVDLVVTGFSRARGKTRIITIFDEEERGLFATHGVVQYDYIALPS